MQTQQTKIKEPCSHHASYRHGTVVVISASTHGRDARGEACLENAEGAVCSYMEDISRQEYEEMYEMLDIEASGNISREDFVKRNSIRHL